MDADEIFLNRDEAGKFRALMKILGDWKKQVSSKGNIVFQDDGKEYPPADYFVFDGFFPGYFSRKKKVLFVARETRWIGGKNFVEESMTFFSGGDVNGSVFWCKVLYMLYGIARGCRIPYSEIPYADTIAKEMVRTGDFGFAVMQLSKYSNDSETGGNRNIWLMNRFLFSARMSVEECFYNPVMKVLS